MTVGQPALCPGCAHLHRDGLLDPPTCDAFPGGIPHRIRIGGFDHRKTFKGDNGIRFEPWGWLGEKLEEAYDARPGSGARRSPGRG